MERKRPAVNDKETLKKIKTNQDEVERPICKYGGKCYRKHPDHLKTFQHPLSSDESQQTVEDDQNLFKIYQMNFPKDLFDFWKFSSTLTETKPREAFKALLNLELVGPFEVLDGVLKNCSSTPNMHVHYRYYYDTPEFMTVMRSYDEETSFHIGYYRDSPDELPVFVASNDAKINNRFKVCGDNLFAAIHCYARSILKSTTKTDFLKKIEDAAKTFGYSVDETTAKMKDRKKKVNCILFNSLGMYVPVENDIGYRPVPMSKDELMKCCEKFCNGTTEAIRDKADEDLQHVITCIQFANDECDYGEGLEFGLNLFLFGSAKLHSRIENLLPLAYKLLRRNLFGQILIDHFRSGRSTSIEELNEISKLT